MEPIDFIITWVDCQDPEWIKEKEKYQINNIGDQREERFRDWNNLKYLFRGIEKYASWVNKVYFVTWGHLPNWLNIDNPKLAIVKHQDFIPEEYLPTFSSRAIDMNFHRIAELSEHFVYFNDDMFITSEVTPDDFFKNNLPCDTAVLNAICFGYSDVVSNERTPFNLSFTAAAFDMIPINRNFNKSTTIRKNWCKWFNYRYLKESMRTLLLLPWRAFPGLMSYHLPYSYLKSTYQEVWEKENEILDQTCRHKFRENTDVNHWVFSYWQIAKGTFYPRSPKLGKYFRISSEPEKNIEAIHAIEKQSYKLICLNDLVQTGNFENVRNQINKALDKILPEKSGFEK